MLRSAPDDTARADDMARADETARAAPPLERMRRYTTWSFTAVVVVFLLGLLPQMTSLPLLLGVAASGALVAWQGVFWERGGPRLLVVVAATASYLCWWWTLAVGGSGFAVVPFALSAALITTTPPRLDLRWEAGAVALAVLPVLVLTDADARVSMVVVTVIMMVTAWSAYRLNRYQFGLYLEVDALRRTEADLAVLRERYRFSSDLHDIQGHTLHVSRLQLQLAGKLLDRDVEAARAHVAEAEQLIAQTIAETRRLAYGERAVTLAGELANATALVEAAGIDLRVDGTAPVGHRLDALFGHLVREATTNLLRHAQARNVVVELSADAVAVVNDGAAESRPLRGLARLGERFEQAGGVLTTRQAGGVFRTEARTQEARVGSTPRLAAGAAARDANSGDAAVGDAP